MSRASIGYGNQGGAGGGQESMNNIFKDRFSYINTAKTTIEKQREFDAALAKLQKDFEQLDTNGDGLVSLEELQVFLQRKVSSLAYVDSYDVRARTVSLTRTLLRTFSI